MGVFNVPVVIGVDEEKLAREIEKDAKNQVIKAVQNRVEDVIFERPTYGNRKNDQPLRDMVKEEIRNFMADKEDLIIEKAAELLANRLLRTKKVREKADKVLDEIMGDQ